MGMKNNETKREGTMRTETREALERIAVAQDLADRAEREPNTVQREWLRREAARARIEAEHAIARLA